MINSNEGWVDESNVIKNIHSARGIEKSATEIYDEAIKELTEAIQLNPKNFKHYFNRATLKVHAGDFEGARSDFRMSANCHRDTNLEFDDYPIL